MRYSAEQMLRESKAAEARRQREERKAIRQKAAQMAAVKKELAKRKAEVESSMASFIRPDATVEYDPAAEGVLTIRRGKGSVVFSASGDDASFLSINFGADP